MSRGAVRQSESREGAGRKANCTDRQPVEVGRVWQTPTGLSRDHPTLPLASGQQRGHAHWTLVTDVRVDRAPAPWLWAECSRSRLLTRVAKLGK